MAPRKAKQEYSDDASEDLGLEEEVSEEEYVPQKKKKKATPRKKKAAASPGDDEEPKPKKPRAKKATGHVTEAFTDPAGWVIQPPSLIYRPDPEAQGGKKIAAFDLDGTLTLVKSGAQFPKGPDDWKWFNKEVPAKLHELVEEGFQLVIFSNQGGIKSALDGKGSQNTRGRVNGVLADLAKKGGAVPVQVFMATQDDDLRKPSTGMWRWFVDHCNAGVDPDKAESFYCGDMAGRSGDIDKTDREFADNVEVPFKTPEEVFGEADTKRDSHLEGDAGHNAALARAFQQLADKARAAGDNMFKISAYEKVSKIIAAWPEPITSSKQVAKEKGVGKGSIAKIDEFLQTGTLAALEGEEVGVAAPKDETALKFL